MQGRWATRLPEYFSTHHPGFLLRTSSLATMRRSPLSAAHRISMSTIWSDGSKARSDVPCGPRSLGSDRLLAGVRVTGGGFVVALDSCLYRRAATALVQLGAIETPDPPGDGM